MIFDFESPREDIAIATVGGKFYNLYILNRLSGIRVPPAFCVADPAVTPAEIERRIAGFERCAVRSSAAQEDLPGLSAAGIFESYLDLEGTEAVREAIVRCFEAAGSERVRSYLAKNGLEEREFAFGAVVQEMVPAEKAGVLFTVNPVNGRREYLGEMIDGLGEDLVSGNKTPEAFSLDPGAPPSGDLPAALWEAARRIEAHYGTPQDIEWAWANGRLFILQSRPVVVPETYPAPPPSQLYPPHEVWTRANIGEIVPRPLTPLSWDVFQEVVLKAYRIKFYSLVDRFFTNLVHLVPRPWPKVLSPKKFEGLPYLNLDTIFKSFGVEPYVDEKVLELGLGFHTPPQAEKPRYHPGERVVRALKTLLYRLERLRPSLAMENRMAAFIDRYLDVWAGKTFLSELERLFFVNRFLFGWHIAITARSFSHLGYMLHLAGAKADSAPVVRQIIAALTAEGGDPYFAEITRLRGLWVQTAAHPGNADHKAAFQQQYDQFLQNFGHRTENEFELAGQSWGEDPHALRAIIEGELMLAPSPGDPPALPRHLRPVLKSLSRAIQQRESLKSRVIRHYRDVRSYALEREKKLAAQKILNEAEDVFYLTLAELEQERDLSGPRIRELVAARKKQHQEELQRAMPYLFYGSAPGAAATEQATCGSSITGVGCSAGRMRGRALVLQSYSSEVRIDKDHIIVTPSADPGWTPLLLKAGGMVTEIGGILSHIATIARENQLPFVVGAQNATSRIRTGQMLVIDGGSGSIVLEDDPDGPA